MSDVEASVRRKVKWRLAYVCTIIIFLSSLDRVNVSFAAHYMEQDIGLTPTLYGFGAGLFFVGYLVSQYPSVFLMRRIGTPAWLFLIMLLWGGSATLTAFIQSPEMYYILRVILGIAEGGLAAGLVLYLSQFNSERDRASNFATPMLAIPISLVIGAPLSAWLMSMENPIGMPNWRWMLLAEGLPTVLFAFLAYWHFPKTPNHARWLTPEEKLWIASNTFNPESKQKSAFKDVWKIFLSPMLWVCATIWFCLLGGAYGVIFWLPQVVRQMSALGEWEVGLITAAPWVGAALGMYFNSKHSDATGERLWHVGLPAATAGVAFILAASQTPVIAFALLLVGGTAMGAAQGAYWSIPTKLFTPAVMTLGVVTVNIAGSSAGTVVPTLVGIVRDETGVFTIPIYIVGGLLFFAAMLVAVVGAAGGKTLTSRPARAAPAE